MVYEVYTNEPWVSKNVFLARFLENILFNLWAWGKVSVCKYFQVKKLKFNLSHKSLSPSQAASPFCQVKSSNLLELDSSPSHVTQVHTSAK